VRDHRAGYAQTLAVLARAKAAVAEKHANEAAAEAAAAAAAGLPPPPAVARTPLITKTSLMLGLGETHDEVEHHCMYEATFGVKASSVVG